jgi:hypothetical protein
MRDAREATHPPSDPHPALVRGSGAAFASDDRPARAQMAAALLLGVVLVASGLYLWRRPHTPSDSASTESVAAAASATMVESTGVTSAFDAGSSSLVRLSDARVLGCQDRGRRHTPADQCDHPKPVEQALSKAIEQAAACVPASAPAGTIEYVADVSFSRRAVRIVLPRAGRSYSDRRIVTACGAAVRNGIVGFGLDGVGHEHARYKISLTATYTGRS